MEHMTVEEVSHKILQFAAGEGASALDASLSKGSQGDITHVVQMMSSLILESQKHPATGKTAFGYSSLFSIKAF